MATSYRSILHSNFLKHIRNYFSHYLIVHIQSYLHSQHSYFVKTLEPNTFIDVLRILKHHLSFRSMPTLFITWYNSCPYWNGYKDLVCNVMLLLTSLLYFSFQNSVDYTFQLYSWCREISSMFFGTLGFISWRERSTFITIQYFFKGIFPLPVDIRVQLFEAFFS